MANISYAEGIIIFKAANKAALDAVVDVFSTASRFGYDTTFNPDDIQVSTNDKGDTVGVVPFYGSGRWTYATNAERMIPWINDNLDSIDKDTLDAVTGTWFNVTLTWREYEFGQSFVASGCAYYHKHAGRDFDTTATVIGDESSDDLSVSSLEEYGFDATFYTDFSREGIENFIDYFMWNDPDAIGDLALYSIDQLADAMRGHEHDIFSSLEYLSEDEEGIKDYRERILSRVRQ
jgi:hypothetical protein